MNIDILKDALGDELFQQVNEKLSNVNGTLANIADGSYIPKAKFDDEHGKVKTLNAQIADLTGKLTEAQQQSGSIDELNSKITSLTSDLASKDAEVQKIVMQYRIKDALRGMNARNVDVIMPLLKMDTITEKDGKLTGLSEQVEEIKKTDGYLFADNPGGRGGFAGGQDIGGAGGDNTNSAVNAAIRAMSGRT